MNYTAKITDGVSKPELGMIASFFLILFFADKLPFFPLLSYIVLPLYSGVFFYRCRDYFEVKGEMALAFFVAWYYAFNMMLGVLAANELVDGFTKQALMVITLVGLVSLSGYAFYREVKSNKSESGAYNVLQFKIYLGLCLAIPGTVV